MRKKTPRPLWVALAISLLGIVSIAVFLWSAPTASKPPVVAEATPPTVEFPSEEEVDPDVLPSGISLLGDIFDGRSEAEEEELSPEEKAEKKPLEHGLSFAEPLNFKVVKASE